MKQLSLIKKALFRKLKSDQIDPEKLNYLRGGDGGDGDGDRPGDGPWGGG